MTDSVVRMFVSSPGDAVLERDEITRLVVRSNKLAKLRGLKPIELVRWPEDLLPGAGSDMQNVINDQAGEFDIFVGVLRSRYGTPTPRSGSGTEEEIERALEQHQRGERPIRIMLYFSNILVRPFDLDVGQLFLIHSFRQRLEGLGVLPFNYNDMDQFRRLASVHISRAHVEASGRVFGKEVPRLSNAGPIGSPKEGTVTDLGDINFKDRVTYPQWADPRTIPLAPYRGETVAVTGVLRSASPHYRFGFKLKEVREPNFGPGNVQTAGQNLLVHIGKNTTSDDLFVTLYKGGIRLGPDVVFDNVSPGTPIELELQWSSDGLVTLAANDRVLVQTFFSIIGIPQLIILSWGDEHHYECNLSHTKLVVGRRSESLT